VDAGSELAGRYVLQERLGQGAVGEVWRARDGVLSRSVAIKVVREKIDDPELARFQREARLAASLQHPGITVVHDIGEQDGQPFIVMELLDGADLAARLEQAKTGLPVNEAISLAIQAADALQAAHAGQVIHRDLKPANLFVLSTGQLKVCDFGIAVAADAADSMAIGSYILGTPAYMSPEQCDGEPADQRSDLYALGCVLYALLTGHPPFPVGPPLTIMAQHRKMAPASVRAARPEVPPALDRLVMSLLAKDPQERPATAGDVASTLRSARSASPKPGRAAEPLAGPPQVPPVRQVPAPGPARYQGASYGYGATASSWLTQLREADRANELRRNRAGSRAWQLLSQTQRLAQHHQTLSAIAARDLTMLSNALWDAITRAAPTADAWQSELGWTVKLNTATLRFEQLRGQSPNPYGNGLWAPFDIVSYSALSLRFSQPSQRYQGRSHSLWYCDAQQAGRYYWYETAFMTSSLRAKTATRCPYALQPSYASSAFFAGPLRVAWPFTAMAGLNLNDFISRWATWLAAAAQGTLRRPVPLPDREPRGSWRRV
jgi:tRNA A-37 threonylcarbamoyl transferase component Bud32